MTALEQQLKKLPPEIAEQLLEIIIEDIDKTDKYPSVIRIKALPDECLDGRDNLHYRVDILYTDEPPADN